MGAVSEPHGSAHGTWSLGRAYYYIVGMLAPSRAPKVPGWVGELQVGRYYLVQ